MGKETCPSEIHLLPFPHPTAVDHGGVGSVNLRCHASESLHEWIIWLLYFFRQGLSLARNWMVLLGWLISDLQGASCHHPLIC